MIITSGWHWHCFHCSCWAEREGYVYGGQGGAVACPCTARLSMLPRIGLHAALSQVGPWPGHSC